LPSKEKTSRVSRKKKKSNQKSNLTSSKKKKSSQREEEESSASPPYSPDLALFMSDDELSKVHEVEE
jgi:chromatin remodeling complex protein RSC6